MTGTTIYAVKCTASAICATVLFLVTSASAASLSAIDSSAYASIVGAEVDSMTSSYDLAADGIDGTITSTVYQGVGAASGYYVYTYQIELYDTTTSSIDSVAFKFSSTPTAIDGIGDAFYVDDGSGNTAPTSASYTRNSATASFEFDLNIAAGETSLEFGLFSPVAPDSTTATLSGTTRGWTPGGRRGRGGRASDTASSGTASVLSNGVAPVPEPTSALVFAIGFATIAARCRPKASRA